MYKKTLLFCLLVLGTSNVAFAAKTQATPENKATTVAQPVTPADVSSNTATTTNVPVVEEDSTIADNNSPEFNFNPSIYFGGQVLYTDMHYSGSSYTLVGRDSVTSTKVGGRGYLGYAFNEFLALETGYNYFGRPELVDKVTGNVQDFLQQGVDFTAKVSLPLDYGFGVYIKGGGLWVFRSGIGSRGGCFADKDANSKFTPYAGLGLSYSFAQNLGIDISYARSMSMGDLPKMDIFAAGLSYKINM